MDVWFLFTPTVPFSIFLEQKLLACSPSFFLAHRSARARLVVMT